MSKNNQSGKMPNTLIFDKKKPRPDLHQRKRIS